MEEIVKLEQTITETQLAVDHNLKKIELIKQINESNELIILSAQRQIELIKFLEGKN